MFREYYYKELKLKVKYINIFLTLFLKMETDKIQKPLIKQGTEAVF